MPSTLLAIHPLPAEYAPFYAGYVAAVPPGDVLATLAAQIDATAALLDGLDERRAGHRYAPGKWSVREVAGHMADTERVFAYRALCAARGEAAALPGFDENAYVAQARFDRRPLPALVDELRATRRATLALYGSFDDEALARRVVANGAPVSLRALVWITAGHERHHQGVLRERYGLSEE